MHVASRPAKTVRIQGPLHCGVRVLSYLSCHSGHWLMHSACCETERGFDLEGMWQAECPGRHRSLRLICPNLESLARCVSVSLMQLHGCQVLVSLELCLSLQVRDIFKRVRDNFPGAEVKASTFDAYGQKLLEAAPQLNLPVVTGEVGDTWINGIASDPFKVSRYRDLLRLRRGLVDSGFSDSYALQNFSRFLLKVRTKASIILLNLGFILAPSCSHHPAGCRAFKPPGGLSCQLSLNCASA